jgi:Tol biopolymer transport system component
VGDPTISKDGTRVVYWTSANSNSSGGHLFSLDLTNPAAVPEQFTFGDWEDSDAIFSPVDNTVAFRRRITAENFDLYTRAIDSFSPAKALVGGTTFDQDPTYSPDGTRLAFRRGTSTTGTRTFVIDLTVADPAATAEPLFSEPIDGFSTETVPAWSRR